MNLDGQIVFQIYNLFVDTDLNGSRQLILLCEHADIYAELIRHLFKRRLYISCLIFSLYSASVDLPRFIVFLDLHVLPDPSMIYMTPDRVLLPIAVIDECADVIGDDLIELGLPVLELLLRLLFHPM